MNILIFGAGAIGAHLAYTKRKKNNIILVSKKKYIKLKSDGVNLSIYSNDILKKNIIKRK